MPNFKYVAEETRVYSDFGIVLPGRIVTAGALPDFRWEPTDSEPTAAPEAPALVTDGNPYEVVEVVEPAPELPAPPVVRPMPAPPAPVADEPPAPNPGS